MSLKDLFAKFNKKSSVEEPSDEGDKPVVVNGYLQTSNTRVIRPVYSNTRAGRAAQEAREKQKNSSSGNDD